MLSTSIIQGAAPKLNPLYYYRGFNLGAAPCTVHNTSSYYAMMPIVLRPKKEFKLSLYEIGVKIEGPL